jgi:Ca2+-binding EF-hand superfamily protein
MINDLCESMRFAPLTPSEISQLMKDLDENEDNLISLDELQNNLQQVEIILKARYKARTVGFCQKIFDSLQKNESESLPRESIRAFCNYLGEQIHIKKLTKGQMNDIMQLLDENSDALISYQEFCAGIDSVNMYLENAREIQNNQINPVLLLLNRCTIYKQKVIFFGETNRLKTRKMNLGKPNSI